jgi:hypothetical protein
MRNQDERIIGEFGEYTEEFIEKAIKFYLKNQKYQKEARVKAASMAKNEAIEEMAL